MLVVLCLLHGQKCRFQKLKTFMKRTNHPLEAKLCTYPSTCNQQHFIIIQKLTAHGPCRKATVCLFSSKACELAYNKGAPLLQNRYLFCWAWQRGGCHV